MIIAVMSVYEEEGLLSRAITSLWAGGVDEIHVFDGAWEDFDDNPTGRSQDDTLEIAAHLNCVVHEPRTVWANQETKRTEMFRRCDARPGDHILVFDADEELEGAFSNPLAEGQHYNMMVRCVGPNDLPGIRGVWPHGDYCADYKPELRLFAYSKALHCKWPGGYWDFAGKIEAYANFKGDSLLPVVDGATFLHHGNDRTPERREQKILFYEKEHRRRRKIQANHWRPA